MSIFSRATLGDGADFSGASFDDWVSFSGANFKGSSKFNGVTWHPDSHYGGTFSGTRFEDVADFRTKNFSAFAALADATFKQRLLLQPPSDGKRPDELFSEACEAAKDAVESVQVPLEKDDERYLLEFRHRRLQVQTRVWSELAGGYRVAKKAMEAAGDFEREQTF